MEDKYIELGKGLYARDADVKSYVRSLDMHRSEGHCCMDCEKGDLWGRRTAWPTSDEGLIEFFKHHVALHDGLKKFQEFLKK